MPHESSARRSGRDADDVTQYWKGIKKEREQLQNALNQVENQARSIEKMRRRILGGISMAGSTGGFNIYDQTKSYASGDMFVVINQITINSITVAAGLYGVPSDGVDAQLARTWDGSVPASPTGNAVPQDPLPATGTCYALLIVPYCV